MEAGEPMEKEGSMLLGLPNFTDIGGGRFKCDETGHELPAAARDAYGRSKACRVALIDTALSKKKPPLNLFKQCPISKSKIVCVLTGDTINKSEEHIWKHINGKRFLNKLEQKEMEKLGSPKKPEKSAKKLKKLPKSTVPADEDDERIKADENEEPQVEKNSDLEEPGFWIPPIGERWDDDDGNDRWESGSASEHESEQNTIDSTTSKATMRRSTNICDGGGTLLCHHKESAVVKIASTSTNAGRYFVGCPNWKTDNCRFFMWVELVGDNKGEKAYSELMANNVKMSLLAEKTTKRLQKLEVECDSLRKKVVDLKVKEGTLKGFTVSLFVFVVFILYALK